MEDRSSHHSFPSIPILIFSVVAVATLCFFWILFSQTIAYGLFLGHLPVGGKTPAEVSNILETYREVLQQKGIGVSYHETRHILYPQTISLNADIGPEANRNLLEINKEKTLQELIGAGNGASVHETFFKRLHLLFYPEHHAPTISVDVRQFTENIKKDFSQFERSSHDAEFIINQGLHTLNVADGQAGQEIDTARALQQLTDALSAMQVPSLSLNVIPYSPLHTRDQLQPLLGAAQTLVPPTPLLLTSTSTRTSIAPATLVTWLTITTSASGASAVEYDEKKIQHYLEERLSPTITTPQLPARYEIHDGRVTAFQAPQEGVMLDTVESAHAIAQTLSVSSSPKRSIELVVQHAPPPAAEQRDTGGITEVVAKATTDFRASPKNRRKNIATGIARINGLIINPDETFSLLHAIGPIDDTNGFLPELVIKGDKTKPEFGGGLCQVSTTLFRAVSYAGLPILERRNHSYRVVYYEPPVGFDATIYDPAPDFKFKNDTGNPLLIQALVKGTTVTVTLWGSKDGRSVEVDTPTVFNIKKPGEAKIVETPDLKPGEKKCTEHAHPGADAFFERRVTYPTGEFKKETFKSHYIVWPAVCLVGKKPDEPPAATSSTPPVVEQPVEQLSTPNDPAIATSSQESP